VTSLEAVLRQIHTDLIEARVSFALIAARGYHRSRDLTSELNILLPPAP